MAHLTALMPYSASVAEAGVAKLRYEKEKDYIATFKALHCGAEATTESKLVRSIATIFPTTHTEQEMKSRMDGYEKASRFLESLTDAELKEFLGGSTTIGSGTGGEVFSSNIDGLPVFIKKIRLTDLEKKHPRATENLFELPSCYQYGVGSQGFGVWREIASHEMTKNGF